jgi:RimJ/RimL family protein N-acetyltransferase
VTVRLIGVLIRQREVTVLAMPEMPTVALRARTEADADVLFSIAADLETWEERSPSAPAPLTRATFDARRARAAESDESDDNVAFVVDVDGRAVGGASLFDFDSLGRHAEAGISLVPAARGRGIGTAAIALLVEFGFVRRNLRRIHLQAIESNTGALRAYEKAGFVVEGRQRQHAWVRGHYEDIVRMGILRSDQRRSDWNPAVRPDDI